MFDRKPISCDSLNRSRVKNPKTRTKRKMKLTEIRATATCCVILRSDFANVGNWVFFADEDQAKTFAEEEGGRVVDEDGMAEKFEAMNCAEAAEYAESAAAAFKDATVYEIEEEEEVEMNKAAQALTLIKAHQHVVKNLMSGKDVIEDKDTPFCCSVASETYWST